MLESGQQIAPNLRLVRELGEGGMGHIWVAEHQALASEVAVKFLNRDFAQDEASLARFRREAQAVAKIDSAHVVRVFDHGVTGDNEPFIVMELLRGEDLQARIERVGPLPIDETVLILTQSCTALGRAHELGIIHRDVKPANIFLTREGPDLFVKMLDFGVAKQVAAKEPAVTDSQTLIGTPYYMSPEQVTSTHRVDHRADLWALAVVTYEMLTGVRPFRGETLGGIHVQICAGKYTRPSAVRAGLTREIDDWFKRALSRKLERRFASAREMAEAFLAATGRQLGPRPRVVALATAATVEAPAAAADTAVASVRTLIPATGRSRLVALAGLGLLLMVGAAAWRLLADRDNREPVGAPSGSPSIEWSGQPTMVPPEVPPAEYRAPDAAVAPSAAGSNSPPAHSRVRRLKAGSAPGSATPRPQSSAASDARPIKDRGF